MALDTEIVPRFASHEPEAVDPCRYRGPSAGHLREPAQRAEAVKLLDLLGMSMRQVVLAVILGLVLAALVLWLVPELVRQGGVSPPSIVDIAWLLAMS